MLTSLRPLGLAVAIVLPAINTIAYADITYADLYSLGKPAAFANGALENFKIGPTGVTVGSVSRSNANGEIFHALVWNGQSTPTDLNPVGYTQTEALATDGVRHVGTASGPSTTNDETHAFLWTGATVTDLNPTGYSLSIATGTGGGQIVGNARPDGGVYHAVAWNGSAHIFVDLHPGGVYRQSYAASCDGTQQVGSAELAVGSFLTVHALLWSGTKSAVDLHPGPAYSSSTAAGIGGGRQVGSAVFTNPDGSGARHAALWAGSSVMTDLNPAGFIESSAIGTDGLRQVGNAHPTGARYDHAALWSSSSASFVDLQAVLPPIFLSSVAYAINGNTVYGLASDTTGTYHAIVWTIVPEPAGMVVLAAGVAIGFRRHRGVRSS